MRILYFTAADSPHDRRFLRALSGTAHQVFALRMQACQPQTPEGVRPLSWPGGQPDWSHWTGWQAGKEQFAAIAADVRPDLVHAGPVQGPAFLAALSGFHPLVTMSWGSDLLRQADRSPWMRFATAYTLDRTDVFLGDCQTVAARAADFGVPRKRRVLFPWGVDLSHFSPENGRVHGAAWRKRLGWQDHFVVMCNRTWAPLYGVDLLARAFILAVEANPALRLLLAGDGPQAPLIRSLLAPLGEFVHFPGRVNFQDLPGLYCAGDVFVSPSHSDGSSISLLEALACGRPVLVSDIPSNREWVRPGQAGELFADDSVLDLTTELLKMAKRPNLSAYQREARQLAEERADWEMNFDKLLQAYQLALSQ
jgi:glycosyltransferase involved in cell wall biosynthesis